MRIDAVPTAAEILARVAGVRERVNETLEGILETAIEICRLHGSELRFDDVYMRVRVAEYMISYTLDLDGRSACIVFVEKLQDDDSGDDKISAA